MDTLFEILKWVGLVFLAGFIGYFGKHLGRIIISRFGKKNGQQTAHSPSKEEGDFKLEKKRLKQEQKIAKKRLKKD
jgi:hypothetical protein